MMLKDFPIKRKLTAVIMLTSGVVLLLTSAAFMIYEIIAFRGAILRDSQTLAQITAANSTAALSFSDDKAATETLSKLQAEETILRASLYDNQGKILAYYPTNLSIEQFPTRPGRDGHVFEQRTLKFFVPVREAQNRTGTLFLETDLQPGYERLQLYGLIVSLILAGSLLVALLLSHWLQKRISQPILELAETAKDISLHRNYEVRAKKYGQDELGQFTDAFNQMLAKIHEQNQALSESEGRVRAVLNSATSAVVVIDSAGEIIDWNARAEKMFGWSRAEAIGRVLADTIIPERYRESHCCGMERFLETGDGPVLNRIIELSALRRDGGEFPVELSISPLKTGDAVTFCGFITDITERKQQEEVRSRFASIVESSEDAITSKNLSGIITSWNPGAEKLFGYAAAEMIGKPMMTIIPPERTGEEREILRRIARGESVDHFETTRVRKDGVVLDVSVTISPIRDDAGKIVGASTIARDISEFNRAQQAIRKSEAQLRLIWENALDGLRLVDENGIIRMVNDSYCRLIGKPREELEGQFLAVLYSPGRKEEILERHQEKFRTRNVPRHQEREVTLWNGMNLIVELTNSFLEVEGQPTLLFSSFRDITERKEAEKREAAFAKLGRSLSAAATAASAAHFIADLADELLGWDACTLDVYAPATDLIYSIINIDTIDGKRVNVPAAYEGKPPTSIMRQVLERGGQLILRREPLNFSSDSIPFGNRGRPSASLIYVPIRRGREIIGILSIQSYTPNAYNQQALNTIQTLADQCGGALERVRAEENLRRLNDELEQRVQQRTAELAATNRELEAFTYSVSHDLRAPLRHIDAFAQILEEELQDDQSSRVKRHINRIRNGVQNMGKLVDDLLNLSRAGRLEIQKEECDFNSIIDEVLADFKTDMANRDIEWRIEELPVAQCDRGLIKQVFMNLISNAIKYTRPRERAVIEIGAKTIDGTAAIFIRDNGVGFNMKYAPKLFGVFQRLHRAEEFEGTGVGLATVQRIIHLHQGRIWADAELDKGATFYFTLQGMERM